MRRSLVISLVGIVVVAVASITAVLATGSGPVLGLDLRGGVSMVLPPDHKVDKGQLNQAVNIIRNRVDALGMSAPRMVFDLPAGGKRLLQDSQGYLPTFVNGVASPLTLMWIPPATT